MTSQESPAPAEAVTDAADEVEVAQAEADDAVADADVADADVADAADAQLTRPPQPRSDAVVLWVAVAGPLVGVIITFVAMSWLTVAFLMLAPLITVVYALGLLVLVRVLRKRSRVRSELGEVPVRYRVYAWTWAAAFILAALSSAIGDPDGPSVGQAILVAAGSIAVVVLTGALWTTYMRDMAWLDTPIQD